MHAPGRPGERRGCGAARLSHPPMLVCAAQGRPRPSLPSGVALQDRPATRFQPEPSQRSRGKMRTETQIDGYRSTRTQTRQDRPWEVVTSPRIAKRFFLLWQLPIAPNSEQLRSPGKPTPGHATLPQARCEGPAAPAPFLLFLPYTAQGNTERPLFSSHPAPAPDEG